MFKLALKTILSKNLKSNLLGKKLTEEEFKPILREIRTTLLNSDVSLPVIKKFLNEVQEEIINNNNSLNKTELEIEIFKVIKEKLIKIVSSKNQEIVFKDKQCSKILVVGMNGSGKTTSTAKLLNYLKNKKNKKVKAVSLDIYRPAAYEQLKKLCDSIEVECYKPDNNDIFKAIDLQVKNAQQEGVDVLIFDTAGLIPNNSENLKELLKIESAIKPIETLYVLDALGGQDSLEVVKHFMETLVITGLLVSKSDSNAPMGAAFSANYLLNVPIKFLGTGEYVQDLTPFYPERIVGQILGEGDVIGLAEKLSEELDVEKTKKSVSRMMSGKFDLIDLIEQIKQMKKLGSLSSIMKYIPNSGISEASINNIDVELSKWEILINSMTRQEKKNPKIFKKEPNRKIRVIKGSGKKQDDLNKLLKKWDESKKKMEEFSKKFSKSPFGFGGLFGKS